MARALIVGIDKYDHLTPLTGCVNDAHEMRRVLANHEDSSTNFSCRVLTSPGNRSITRIVLRRELEELFDNYEDDTLFYFSGHGHPAQVGGFIVTQEAEPGDPGILMDELLSLANKATARSVLLILDCCFAGALGDPGGENKALLRPGLTILAASRPLQLAGISGGYSVFTKLIVEALDGAAADVRGNVSAAAIYAFAEQGLGPWDQRAAYKSHTYKLPPVRKCNPHVREAMLRWLPSIFDKANDSYQMDPSYEFSEPTANPKNVEIFNKFKVLRNAHLLTTEDDKDLYFVTLESKSVKLTPLGQFYWRLAKSNNLR
jgi:hypothetical protein